MEATRKLGNCCLFVGTQEPEQHAKSKQNQDVCANYWEDVPAEQDDSLLPKLHRGITDLDKHSVFRFANDHAHATL
jgi:hypothetical protein